MRYIQEIACKIGLRNERLRRILVPLRCKYGDAQVEAALSTFSDTTLVQLIEWIARSAEFGQLDQEDDYCYWHDPDEQAEDG